MLPLEQLFRLPLGQHTAIDQRRRHGVGVLQIQPRRIQLLLQLRQLRLGDEAASLDTVKKCGNKLGRHEREAQNRYDGIKLQRRDCSTSGTAVVYPLLTYSLF